MQFDIIAEAQLRQPGLLDGYRYLVIPLVTHLREDEVAAIQNFVANGGELVLLGNKKFCALYDEWGNERPLSPIANLPTTNLRRLMADVGAVRGPSSIYRQLTSKDQSNSLYLWLVNLNRHS